MRLTRLASGLVAIPVLLVSLVLSINAPAAPAPPCQEGWTKGAWDLPAGAGSGFAEGKLVSNLTGNTVYKMECKLIATPSPCLSCIQGTMYGYLDDGFGPSPDYLVKGSYSGTWLNGQGTFGAYVYELNGAGPVGKIGGVFADPPFPVAIGEYKGEWVVCP
ncbi:hypothetical protein [Engelhardtia mirabilis]|uniref:Uncharacterized protein n=1 Tax=Engelhardtia mirabilis TaxID=2528011 RepID=A0A518BDC3_9BACT|nr:hypothetical protein Pla133_00490 [Planctomycetes bacterium Pla133]QDU99313.1 hypothetical protein Pla86_00490 [Planctomycetes bacterium Pla86]